MRTRLVGLMAACWVLAVLYLSSPPVIHAQASSPETIAVVSAVAPTYTPVMAVIQRNIDLSYTVKVEVRVNDAGVVTTAKALNGIPLFRKVSEDAAIRWRFVASGEKERFAELKFIYSLVYWEAGAAALTPVFTLPDKVEVKHQLKQEEMPNVGPQPKRRGRV